MSTGTVISIGICSDAVYPDYPHKLVIKTMLDDVVIPMRVEVRNRRTGAYLVSTVTGDNGFAIFTHLPAQSLASPHCVTCFDDRVDEFVNASIFDRVFQWDDQGYPPET